MRIMTLLSVFGLALTVQAFAHGDKGGGPCKQYFKTCKENNTAKADMQKCVSDAATAANDTACLGKLKKGEGRHGHHHAGGESTGASGGTSGN